MSDEPTWDRATADWYATNYGEYATNRLGVAAIEFGQGDVVVDIGCGTGSALRAAAEWVTSGRLIGVDPVPRMLEIAKQRALSHPAAARIEFLPGPAHALPLPADTADVVLAFDSFDHWGERNKLAGLHEVRRVLRPGGRFVAVKDGAVANAASRDGFVQLATSAGFELVYERQLSDGDVACRLWELRCKG